MHMYRGSWKRGRPLQSNSIQFSTTEPFKEVLCCWREIECLLSLSSAAAGQPNAGHPATLSSSTWPFIAGKMIKLPPQSTFRTPTSTRRRHNFSPGRLLIHHDRLRAGAKIAPRAAAAWRWDLGLAAPPPALRPALEQTKPPNWSDQAASRCLRAATRVVWQAPLIEVKNR